VHLAICTWYVYPTAYERMLYIRTFVRALYLYVLYLYMCPPLVPFLGGVVPRRGPPLRATIVLSVFGRWPRRPFGLRFHMPVYALLCGPFGQGT